MGEAGFAACDQSETWTADRSKEEKRGKKIRWLNRVKVSAAAGVAEGGALQESGRAAVLVKFI